MSALDRRGFLAIAGSAAVASGVGPMFAQQEKRRGLKKAAMLGMVGEGATLREKFALLHELGFHGVELDSPSDLTTEAVLDAKQATGLEIEGVVDSVHWNTPLSDPDATVRERGRAALERALRDCKAWGGSSVLLVPAVVNERVGYDEAWERSTAEIRKLLPLAKELGVQIAVENVWNNFLLSPLEAVRYVDQFESPALGWHFDIGNVVTYGWPEQWIRILGKRIVKLHIKEYSRKKRDAEGLWKGFEVELGEGDCRWREVMAALDAIGYRGWACAEVAGGDRSRLKLVSAQMDRILEA
jgi:hexulose-6-phosphate isomerase